MTDGQLLCAIGAALHGPLWMAALARALGVNERTLRRWAADRMPVPGGVWDRLQAMYDTRTSAVQAELAARPRPRPR